MGNLFTKLSIVWARQRAQTKAALIRERPLDLGVGAEGPIRTVAQDLLRRADYAERIANVLADLRVHEGRVFAIRGGWGFGKSSLKNLISEKLDADNRRVDWLDFNPWQWGDGDAIARALFGQLADRLGGEHSEGASERAKALRRYGEILTGSGENLKKIGSSPYISSFLTNASVLAMASSIGFELPAAATVAAILACASFVVPPIGRLIAYFGRDRSGESLDKIRRDLEDRLRALDRPLVVFVDDIDRLEPEQIRSLLRQVKANANLPNIVFVLLFQVNIIEAALDEVSNKDGRSFLEKIVQTNFDLPAVPTNVVHQIFATELAALIDTYATEENGFTGRRWGNAFIGCIKPMLRNMRDARRLISSIAVHLPLHVEDNVLEVNIIDFILLETLRVFEPDLLQAIFKNQDLVLQHRRRGHGRRDGDRNAAKILLETSSEERRIVVGEAIKDLFPPLEWAYGGNTYDDGSHQRWLSEKRVCSARYFSRYFEMQAADGEISERRFVEFIDATGSAEDLSEVVARFERNGLLPSLVARFDESNDRLPAENAAILLPEMFRIAQKFSDERGADPFNSLWISAWRATSWYLKKIPAIRRGDLALQALRLTEALSVAATLIHLSDPDDNRREGVDFVPTLTEETVDAMKAEWLRIIRIRAAPDGNLIDDLDLSSLLYRWKDYTASFDEPKAFVARSIQTDEGFARIASRFMGVGRTHTAGDRVSSIIYRFNRETISDLIGLDVADARCAAINPDHFPEHKKALETLSTSLDDWLGRRPANPFD